MSITLLTGVPGAGKTLFAVSFLVEELAPTGRTIYCNINGLDIPAIKELVPDAGEIIACDKETPLDWMDYEDDAIFIFDEVQEQYVPRNGAAKVPPYIAAYETHRHRGFDFLFITQGPKLIDRHLHDLVERHIHMYRPYGLSRSRKLEWNGVNPNPNPPQSNTNAEKRNWRFPKKYFPLYKSAVAHTGKVRLPWRLLLIIPALLVAISILSYTAYATLVGRDRQDVVAQSVADNASESGIAEADRPVCHFRVVAYLGEYLAAVAADNARYYFSDDELDVNADGRSVLIQDDVEYFLCN